MYPLDRGMWGPTVRITHLGDELATRADLDVVSGSRGPRRRSLVRYAASGRLRGLDGVYVESSTFLPAETDIAFLGLARALSVPVLTYVRDAYQLFRDDYPVASLRGWISVAAFRPAMMALRATSSRLAFPTAGLARAVGVPPADAVLLPPGAPAPVRVERSSRASRLLYVGDARLPMHGAVRLIAAVELARRAGVEVSLDIVCREGQEPPGPWPEWVRIRRGEGDAIHALLPDVIASVIPRPRNPYNDLALPIKLFDYLSYGRPILATNCVEQSHIVRETGSGVIVGDDVEDIAQGIRRLRGAAPAELDHWSSSAAAAATQNSWSSRAEKIVGFLTTPRFTGRRRGR